MERKSKWSSAEASLFLKGWDNQGHIFSCSVESQVSWRPDTHTRGGPSNVFLKSTHFFGPSFSPHPHFIIPSSGLSPGPRCLHSPHTRNAVPVHSKGTLMEPVASFPLCKLQAPTRWLRWEKYIGLDWYWTKKESYVHVAIFPEPPLESVPSPNPTS